MADGAEGLEPLHTAALQGHADVVQMILDQGFDINTVVFKTKQSALHIASDKGHIQIVTLLTSRGSWPCRLCQTAWHARTLTVAATLTVLPNRSLPAAFLPTTGGINLDLQDVDGRSAMHLAVRKSHIRVADALVAASCSLKVKDNDGLTALHEAARSDEKKEIVTSLMSVRGCPFHQAPPFPRSSSSP
jgi:ankyrin repeat protein